MVKTTTCSGESLGPKLSPEHVIVATIILAIFCFVLRYSA